MTKKIESEVILMERKRNKKTKRSQMRNKLLCYFLAGALLFGNLIDFQHVSVSAEEEVVKLKSYIIFMVIWGNIVKKLYCCV